MVDNLSVRTSAGGPGDGAIDLLGLGCVAVDDLVYVDRYPTPDEKQEVQRRYRVCGGLTAAALMAAAAQGLHCAFGGHLGDDELSRCAASQLELAGVSLRHLRRENGVRPIASTIVVDVKQATRNIFYDLSGLQELPAQWPDEQVLQQVRGVFVDHFNVAAQTRAAQSARERGVPVIADFERHDAPGFDRLLQLVDHLVLGQGFAQLLTSQADPRDAATQLWHGDRKSVIITCGVDGCVYLTGDSTDIQQFPAFAVEAVDTTGCGDVFHGVYAAGIVASESVHDSIRLATGAAAIKASRSTGEASPPTRAELMQFLEKHE